LHLLRAAAELSRPHPRFDRVRLDYDRAIAINPRDPPTRLDFAELLERFGDIPAAIEQYRLALAINDDFHPDEPRRLSPARVGQVQAKLTMLESTRTRRSPSPDP
jgi:tetratricopeptide (TPR) repeat protein